MNPDYYPWILLAIVCLVANCFYRYRWKREFSRRDAVVLPDIPTNIPMPPVKAPLLSKHRTGPGGHTDQRVDELLQALEDEDDDKEKETT